MEETDNDMIWTTRFIIQKILVPIVVVFGIVGNTISIVVLTRSWMRCSTNYYLTALAVYDTLYLIFAMIMSLSHYTLVKDRTWYLLYQYPIGKPLVDTFSNTAVWLTITFTIERWICVCLPIRGRVWCTPKRAKHVIIAVCIAAAIITFPEFFENIVILDSDSKHGKLDAMEYNHTETSPPNSTVISFLGNLQNISDPQNLLLDTGFALDAPSSHFVGHQDSLVESYADEREDKWVLQKSSMAESRVYQVGYVLSSQVLFTFLPLIILLIFNSVLISTVYGASKRRRAMVRYTNQQTRKQEKIMREQQRVTITLIAVVIMFILTQTPQAIQNIYSHLTTSSMTQHKRNILLVTGNVFNLLVMINSAINFVLYSTFNTKFRRTVRRISLHRRKATDTGEIVYKKTMLTSQLSVEPHAHEMNTLNGMSRAKINNYNNTTLQL